MRIMMHNVHGLTEMNGLGEMIEQLQVKENEIQKFS